MTIAMIAAIRMAKRKISKKAGIAVIEMTVVLMILILMLMLTEMMISLQEKRIDKVLINTPEFRLFSNIFFRVID